MITCALHTEANSQLASVFLKTYNKTLVSTIADSLKPTLSCCIISKCSSFLHVKACDIVDFAMYISPSLSSDTIHLCLAKFNVITIYNSVKVHFLLALEWYVKNKVLKKLIIPTQHALPSLVSWILFCKCLIVVAATD